MYRTVTNVEGWTQAKLSRRVYGVYPACLCVLLLTLPHCCKSSYWSISSLTLTLANVAIAAAIFRCEVTPAVTLLRRHLTAECRREHVVYLVYFRGIVPLSCIKQLAISLWRCWNWGDRNTHSNNRSWRQVHNIYSRYCGPAIPCRHRPQQLVVHRHAYNTSSAACEQSYHTKSAADFRLACDFLRTTASGFLKTRMEACERSIVWRPTYEQQTDHLHCVPSCQSSAGAQVENAILDRHSISLFCLQYYKTDS